METRIKEKPFSFTVNTALQPYSEKFQLDKNVIRVLGIAISSDYPELLYYRGTQKIEINSDELFEENHESKMLMRGLAEKKYYELGDAVFPGNGEVKIVYRDNNNTNAAFQPYKVTLYLLVEIK
jgi:hypothetical protein